MERESIVNHAVGIKKEKKQFHQGLNLATSISPYPVSNPIAPRVGNHGEVIKKSQDSSAVAELCWKQQKTLPEVGRSSSLLGQNPSNQLRAIAKCPDLPFSKLPLKDRFCLFKTNRCWIYWSKYCGIMWKQKLHLPLYLVLCMILVNLQVTQPNPAY